MSYNLEEHPETDDLIQAALETALAPEVLAHAQECPACNRYILEIRALKAHLSSIDEEDIPAHLRQQILAHAPQLAAKSASGFSALRWYRNPLLWIAGVVGLAVFAYIFIVFLV